jgi:hypothetical protein
MNEPLLAALTLGNAAAARVRLIVWCLDCHHQVEPDPAEMAERYGAEMTVPDCTPGLSAPGEVAGEPTSSSPGSVDSLAPRSKTRGAGAAISLYK